MEDDTVLTRLLAVLDALSNIARFMHPVRLAALISGLDDRDTSLRRVMELHSGINEHFRTAGTFASRACAELRAAVDAANPMREVHRAMRQYYRALEALAALIENNAAVGGFFLEPCYRDDPSVLQRLAKSPNPDTGIFHFENNTDQRGGYSVYVPSGHDQAHPAPVIFALHGGSGHGRLFLWNWLREARSRGLIIVAPTAIGSTWSLMEPEIDCQNLQEILTQVRDRWTIDPARIMLMGMSDGGTFTLLSGLADDSPFTHLAPAAASFHPMLLAMTGPQRLTALPIHLTHGSQDWMFPVHIARTAHRTLAAAGAAITYREIADLAHAYPREEQGALVEWFLG